MRVGRGVSGAIAVHEALDTGVHGVGSDTIASDADITTHAAIAATASVKAHATAAQITKLDAIETSAARDLTGAEIVALLEALGASSRLSHTKLDDVGAADHHAVYLDAAALAAAKAGGLNKIIWLAASVTIVSDTNRTATLNYTDMDFTAATSADAKFAIIQTHIQIDSITGGSCAVSVRKNGDTPDYKGRSNVYAIAGDTAGVHRYATYMIALDGDEVAEYEIGIGGTIQVDTVIQVLGYIE